MDVKNLETKMNKEEQNSINNKEEINFEKGDFTDKEHRLFLESFILYDKNFKEMTQYTQTKNYNEILVYSDKFINYLNKKFNKKEGTSNLIIDKENINNYSNEELEEYINNKFCLSPQNSFKENINCVEDFFLDDNKSLLGLNNNNKKIFFIRKYPKYKTLLNNNLNIENKNLSEINVPNIGNDKESRKKLINKLLNENCKEANCTKMEELAKMSEILQIINKVENYNVTNDESLISKTKSLGTYDSNSNKNNNQFNNLNNNNLGKKRSIKFNSIIENEKKEKDIENLNNLYQLNDKNIKSNFQKDNFINNNNLFQNNNLMKNLFLSSQNNIFPQHKNIIPNQNLNNPYLFNQINPINYFSNPNLISNYNNNLINQQLLSHPFFNLPFPTFPYSNNINQSIIYERNNQNPFYDNLNLLNNQQNFNLNSINYVNNFNNENQTFNFFPQNNLNLFNNQNRESNNNNLQNLSNLSNINLQNSVNINKNQNDFNHNF